MSNKITVIDFDETLYKHDSLIKFCLFIYRKRPIQSVNIIIQIIAFVLHTLKLINTKRYKEIFLSFAKGINEEELYQFSVEFWKKEYPSEFNSTILEAIKKSERTICISASPELYLKYICQQLNIELIGTRIQYKGSKYRIVGENCKAEEKLNRLKEYLKSESYEIDNSYSDSMTDTPLFNISNNAYLVIGNNIKKL